MVKTIIGCATYYVDNKTILLISKEYTGEPAIGWIPDVLVCSKTTYDKHYKEINLGRNKYSKDTKIILIEDN